MPERSQPVKSVIFEATRPLLIDTRGTTKSYMALYTVMKEFSHRNPETMIELLIPNSKGLLHDVATWCTTTGNELVSSELGNEEGEENMHILIQKGVRRSMEIDPAQKKEKTMTIILSTADLDYLVAPLDKALAGAVLGMEIRVVFEGAGIKLLQSGYRSTRSGVFGTFWTSGVESKLRHSRTPLPFEAIAMLEEMGAKFYIDGPSMEAYGMRQEKLIVEHPVVASTVTWVSMLAKSDVNVFSKAKLEIP